VPRRQLSVDRIEDTYRPFTVKQLSFDRHGNAQAQAPQLFVVPASAFALPPEPAEGSSADPSRRSGSGWRSLENPEEHLGEVEPGEVEPGEVEPGEVEPLSSAERHRPSA